MNNRFTDNQESYRTLNLGTTMHPDEHMVYEQDNAAAKRAFEILDS